MEEKRRTRRFDLDITTKLTRIKGAKESDMTPEETFEVDIVNISKDGLAFKSKYTIDPNSYYNAKITLWTKESCDTILQIARTLKDTDGSLLYGCRFIGITGDTQLKMDIYELIHTRFNEGSVAKL